MSDCSRPDPLDLTGCLVRALALYSLAEFQLGHAKTIRVSAAGASFSVVDDGRGHAIERTVDGSPYLKFVYTHLDYPFQATQSSPIQLHGIGMSLVNILCSELSVTARKREATLQMNFLNGQLSREELIEIRSEDTGNLISGTVRPQFQSDGANSEYIRRWLLRVHAGSPSLKLYFNGQALHGSPADAA
jgi:DNA gyrase/topoisomerase IV subunit B